MNKPIPLNCLQQMLEWKYAYDGGKAYSRTDVVYEYLALREDLEAGRVAIVPVNIPEDTESSIDLALCRYNDDYWADSFSDCWPDVLKALTKKPYEFGGE